METTSRQTAFSLRAPRTQLDPDQVLEVITQSHSNLPSTIALSVDADDALDPLIIIREHEREATIRLVALTERFERAGIDAAPTALLSAFLNWVDTRPVSDVTAEQRGIATIGWSQREARIAWRVQVPRPSGRTADWVPTVHTDARLVRTIRDNAMRRSEMLTVTAHKSGDVTVWAYAVNDALSTAVLAQPDSLATGHPLDNLFAVFTPGRPVAVATEVAAIRLTEESSEPHEMLSLTALNQIGWM